MRTMLNTIERKVEEEVLRSKREMEDTRDSTEQKLVSLVEKMKADERAGLDRERKLMEQVQDGLNTMN